MLRCSSPEGYFGTTFLSGFRLRMLFNSRAFQAHRTCGSPYALTILLSHSGNKPPRGSPGLGSFSWGIDTPMSMGKV
ncbi:hypothetical protein BDQ94DRAFT_143542 [Aspergillus welwitschiae]|uniref:Uncharacterized protein n=1 Tax=Aspergillus welwitschiae TaxID=1341132 RepID=A0A3F3Q3L1_9EURO|nr:hypothetical protein BDQ94DRAFT_143542 [Aspergillus welwitschiae]RDH33675.1 hypothetical protein BDQ94DRAFT_143542 [Aspergillus welwitschiae]